MILIIRVRVWIGVIYFLKKKQWVTHHFVCGEVDKGLDNKSEGQEFKSSAG